jgi:hypothetical protein
MSTRPSPLEASPPATEHIAITDDFRDLRKLLLLFDKVGLRNLDTALYVAESGVPSMNIQPCPPIHAELTALVSDGLLFQPKEEDLWLPSSPADSFVPAASEDPVVARLATELHSRSFWHTSLVFKHVVLRGHQKGMLQQFQIAEPLEEVERLLDEERERSKPLETRLIAARLRAQGIHAHPIVDLSATSPPEEAKQVVTEVVLTGLPIISIDVPLADLVAFRNNPDSRHLLLSLRRWIRSLSEQKLTAAELQDEIEWHISEYRRHLQVHRMRASQGILKIAIKSPLEILENVFRLRLSKAIDAVFAIQELRTSLMADEISAPSRELAYIIKAHAAFPSSE